MCRWYIYWRSGLDSRSICKTISITRHTDTIKKEGRDDDIVTLAFFPSGVLPGTASVYKGTILKGRNQFAGMVGFLPYEFSRAEGIKLLAPDTAIPVIVKAVASLIVAINPSTMLFAGGLLDSKRIKQVLAYIPRSICRSFTMQMRSTPII